MSIKKRPENRGRKQPYIDHEDGGYSVLHFTKGWRKVSPKRLEAQMKMAQILG